MLRNLRQQGFGKIGGGEEDQVVDLFPHAHKTDGQAQLFVHTDDAATLGGAVQLGQHNAGGTGGAAELLRLADGVLAGNGIQHQQHFQAGIRAGLFTLRLIFASSSIRPFLLCRRPAVSAMTIS